MIKQAQSELEPIILHLVNRVMKTTTFPNILKTSRYHENIEVPIRKIGKEPDTSEGWRPVNVVAAIAKIIERILLKQLLNHLDVNDLIGHAHHGAVKNKSTQSVITELHDKLLEDMENDTDTALLVLDQSKAYDVVCHRILLRKFEAIGFKTQAIEMMRSYLSDRKQFVQVEGQRSDKLVLGPRFVIQGSTMSCVMFLIYILDLPSMFHVSCATRHNPLDERTCQKPRAKTFVDDTFIHVTKKEDETMIEAVNDTMEKVVIYMKANKLALNSDKSQVMVISKNNAMKSNFAVTMNNKVIKHKEEITILGNTLSASLTWEAHVSNVLLPALRNRVQTLRLITRYLPTGFRAIYANSIFRSRLMFGIETWGGAPLKLINKIQDLQNKASKLALPRHLHNKNHRQRQEILHWLPIRKEIMSSTHKHTFKIMNLNIPEELATQMPRNSKNLRIQHHNKLDTKPRWLSKNKRTRASYRFRAYHWNTLPKELTSQVEYKKFKKGLKSYFNAGKGTEIWN